MANENPSYYAIIPATVRYADIPANAKLLFGEITALSNKEGYCWATDKYFADLYGVSAQSVNNWIALLKKMGFIRNELTSNETGTMRKIYILTEGVYKKNKGGSIKEVIEGSIRKVISNTTRENNTSNKILAEQSSAEKAIPHLLKLFEAVNPTHRFYGNTTQRAALLRLIQKYGEQRMENCIRILPRVITQKYAPMITSPVQLENKMGELVAFLKRSAPEKSKVVDI